MTDDEAADIRIVRERVVYANSYGELYDDDVEFRPAGARGRYVRWGWRAPYSVAVLPLVTADTALLVRSFRHSARHDVLEAVKGFGDARYEPADVAATELREELGFTASDMTYLGVTFADSSFAHHPLHCFIAVGQLDGDRSPEGSEAILGSHRFALKGTPDALAAGTVQDAVTLLMLWQAYNRRGTDGQ